MVKQGQHYYSYGKINEYEGAGSPSFQPYKFGGKEEEPMHGLNLLDFHARQYDPVLGRPLTMDPLTEKFPWQSPYLWCSVNPVNRIDPDGKQDVWGMAGMFYGSNIPVALFINKQRKI